MARIRITFPLLLLMMTTSVFAQATRTWVSGLGLDSNPCSRSAPCKTFAGAIANTADGGEISVMDPGGYGGVTITKSLRIDGGGFVASVVASGITVNTTGHVELANIQFNGINTTATGINVIAAGSLLIDNVDITNYTTTGVNLSVAATTPVQILNSRIHNLVAGANGVYGTASAGLLRLRMTDSTITDVAGGNGAYVLTGALLTLDNTQISGCNNGVRADGNAVVNISGSTINQNTNYGVYSVATGALTRVFKSFVQDNVMGGYLVTSPSAIDTTGNNSIQAGAGLMLQNIGLQ